MLQSRIEHNLAVARERKSDWHRQRIYLALSEPLVHFAFFRDDSHGIAAWENALEMNVSGNVPGTETSVVFEES